MATIIEITPIEIKYKKHNLQDGPLYVDNKSDIKMIIFANGMRETFEEANPKLIIQNNTSNQVAENLNNDIEDHKMYYIYQNYKIGQPQMQSILMQTKDKKIMKLVVEAQTARKRETIFIATFPLAIGGMYIISYASSYSNRNNADSNIYYAIGGVAIAAAIACPIVSIANKHKKMNCNTAAIKLYNQKY